MTWRPAGDSSTNRVPGGLPARRPDQANQVPLTRAGTGPAPQTSTFRQIIVAGPGPGEGVFVYAAGTTPGLGNPPIVSITNGTTDPFGNPVVPGLDVTQGQITGTVISASSFIGTDFIINTSGVFFYNGAPAAGNLIVALAPLPGTDSFGNPFGGGIQLASPAAFKVLGTSGQEITMQISAGTPALGWFTGAAPELRVAEAFATTTGSGGTLQLQLEITGGTVTGFGDIAGVFLASSSASGGFTAGGSLIYQTRTSVVQLPLTWGVTGTKVRSAIAGDTNIYQPERLSFVQAASLLVTAGPTQFMTTWNMGVGRYIIDGQILLLPTVGAGTALFQFSGTAAMTNMEVVFEERSIPVGGGPGGFGNSQVVTAFASNFTSAALGLANRVVTFRGSFNVGTAGSAGIFATAAGGASYNIILDATYMNLNPVGP